ncbi:MAG: hypothetical protein ACRENZ_07780 [Thermodesulfobacteriota bacterium]
MNGYFSRLIQQTGVTIEPSAESRSLGTEPTSSKQKTGDETLGPPIEEDVHIHSKQGQAFETNNDNIVEDSEISYHISQHEAIDQPKEELYETKILQDRQSQMPGSQRSGLRVEKPEQIRQDHTEMDLQLPYEEQGHKRLINPGQIRDRKELIKHDKETKGDHVESGEGLFAPVHQIKNEYTVKPVNTSDEKVSQAQTWQSYLREVRKWVAATPEDKQVELNNRDQVRVSDIKKTALISIDENRGLIKDYDDEKGSQKNNELEINDFHLSIGTINLTIEEPRNEVQSKKPPPIKIGEGKRQLESESTRLSRHYIRIR